MDGLYYPFFIPGDKSRVDEAGWKSAERSWKRIGDSMWAVLGDMQKEIERTRK